jgi:hypothetical protein
MNGMILTDFYASVERANKIPVSLDNKQYIILFSSSKRLWKCLHLLGDARELDC